MRSISRVAVMACFVMLMSSSCGSDARQARAGRKIVVGGEEHWRFGFNYSAWAVEAGPFRVGDTLVFEYKPSMFNGVEVNHNVFRLHGMKAYNECSFGRGQLLANTTQGNPGFKFTLTQRKKAVYFACSIAQGIHCNEGLMKFWVVPR